MIGQELGHYRIEEKLGEGGMGVVYKAHDTHLGRPVAIKVLSPEAMSHPARKQRFVQEARTASSLNHPNILHIYDIDAANGVDFMAMEFVSGKTLDQLFGPDGLPMGEALHYAIQIAAALARAHEAGIVHRDIKPANIMVTAEGLVKVLDFGLAKLTEPLAEIGDSSVTRTTYGPRTELGAIIGTIQYMSPEQAEGKSVDPRSDIFSFGALLYEMVTGQRPFQGGSPVGILSAILSKEPVPLSEVRTSVPAEIDRIVGRCLRKDQRERFQSMGEVKSALEEAAQALRLSSTVGTPRPQAPAAERPRRRRLAWAGAGIAAASILAAVAPWGRMSEVFRSGGGARTQLVAVLAFESVGGPAERAFAGGVREVLGRSLCRLDQFQNARRVLPPRDVHGDATRTPGEARTKLGANLALTGAVERAGGRVRLRLKLVDAATLQQVDHVETDLPLSDPSGLMDGLDKAVTSVLRFRVSARQEAALTPRRTKVGASCESYLEAYGNLQAGDRAEDLDRAADLFRTALAKDPSFGPSQAGLAESLWAKSMLTRDKQAAEEARQTALRALSNGADLPEVHVLLGQVYAGTGQPQEAVEEFRRALEMDPLNLEGHTGLGEALEALGRLTDSENAYKALVGLWPGYLVPYSHLAAFYLRQGRYQEAEPMFRKVVELAPENAAGYQNLGGLYHMLGRAGEAAAALKRAIAIQPTAPGYTNLGTLYFFQGRYSDAVPLMEKAVEMEPNDWVYWGNLGDAYRWTPDFRRRAPAAYARAIQLAAQQPNINPNDGGLHSTLALYRAKLGDASKALGEIAEARRLAPMNSRVLFKAALVYEITGKREQALNALDLALQGGYSRDEVRSEPELAELRKDPRYQRLDKEPSAARAAR